MPTSEDVVQLPPDGQGKKLRAQTGGNMPAGTFAEVLALQNRAGDLVDPAADGADGANPPAIPGSGIRGWLRAIYDKLSATLTVGGTVTVANLADLSGTWGYLAGASGTRAVTGRVLGIAAHASSGGATVTINGGDAIPVPTGAGIELTPIGNLVDPTLVFTGTDSYMVETVT